MGAALLLMPTGGSGDIGSRLLRVREEGGCAVRSLARHAGRVAPGRATTLGALQTSAQRALQHEVHDIPSERIQELIG